MARRHPTTREPLNPPSAGPQTGGIRGSDLVGSGRRQQSQQQSRQSAPMPAAAVRRRSSRIRRRSSVEGPDDGDDDADDEELGPNSYYDQQQPEEQRQRQSEREQQRQSSQEVAAYDHSTLTSQTEISDLGLLGNNFHSSSGGGIGGNEQPRSHSTNEMLFEPMQSDSVVSTRNFDHAAGLVHPRSALRALGRRISLVSARYIEQQQQGGTTPLHTPDFEAPLNDPVEKGKPKNKLRRSRASKKFRGKNMARSGNSREIMEIGQTRSRDLAGTFTKSSSNLTSCVSGRARMMSPGRKRDERMRPPHHCSEDEDFSEVELDAAENGEPAVDTLNVSSAKELLAFSKAHQVRLVPPQIGSARPRRRLASELTHQTDNTTCVAPSSVKDALEDHFGRIKETNSADVTEESPMQVPDKEKRPTSHSSMHDEDNDDDDDDDEDEDEDEDDDGMLEDFPQGRSELVQLKQNRKPDRPRQVEAEFGLRQAAAIRSTMPRRRSSLEVGDEVVKRHIPRAHMHSAHNLRRSSDTTSSSKDGNNSPDPSSVERRRTWGGAEEDHRSSTPSMPGGIANAAFENSLLGDEESKRDPNVGAKFNPWAPAIKFNKLHHNAAERGERYTMLTAPSSSNVRGGEPPAGAWDLRQITTRRDLTEQELKELRADAEFKKPKLKKGKAKKGVSSAAAAVLDNVAEGNMDDEDEEGMTLPLAPDSTTSLVISRPPKAKRSLRAEADAAAEMRLEKLEKASKSADRRKREKIQNVEEHRGVPMNAATDDACHEAIPLHPNTPPESGAAEQSRQMARKAGWLAEATAEQQLDIEGQGHARNSFVSGLTSRASHYSIETLTEKAREPPVTLIPREASASPNHEVIAVEENIWRHVDELLDDCLSVAVGEDGESVISGTVVSEAIDMQSVASRMTRKSHDWDLLSQVGAGDESSADKEIRRRSGRRPSDELGVNEVRMAQAALSGFSNFFHNPSSSFRSVVVSVASVATEETRAKASSAGEASFRAIQSQLPSELVQDEESTVVSLSSRSNVVESESQNLLCQSLQEISRRIHAVASTASLTSSTEAVRIAPESEEKMWARRSLATMEEMKLGRVALDSFSDVLLESMPVGIQAALMEAAESNNTAPWDANEIEYLDVAEEKKALLVGPQLTLYEVFRWSLRISVDSLVKAQGAGGSERDKDSASAINKDALQQSVEEAKKDGSIERKATLSPREEKSNKVQEEDEVQEDEDKDHASSHQDIYKAALEAVTQRYGVGYPVNKQGDDGCLQVHGAQKNTAVQAKKENPPVNPSATILSAALKLGLVPAEKDNAKEGDASIAPSQYLSSPAPNEPFESSIRTKRRSSLLPMVEEVEEISSSDPSNEEVVVEAVNDEVAKGCASKSFTPSTLIPSSVVGSLAKTRSSSTINDLHQLSSTSNDLRGSSTASTLIRAAGVESIARTRSASTTTDLNYSSSTTSNLHQASSGTSSNAQEQPMPMADSVSAAALRYGLLQSVPSEQKKVSALTTSTAGDSVLRSRQRSRSSSFMAQSRRSSDVTVLPTSRHSSLSALSEKDRSDRFASLSKLEKDMEAEYFAKSVAPVDFDENVRKKPLASLAPIDFDGTRKPPAIEKKEMATRLVDELKEIRRTRTGDKSQNKKMLVPSSSFNPFPTQTGDDNRSNTCEKVPNNPSIRTVPTVPLEPPKHEKETLGSELAAFPESSLTLHSSGLSSEVIPTPAPAAAVMEAFTFTSKQRYKAESSSSSKLEALSDSEGTKSSAHIKASSSSHTLISSVTSSSGFESARVPSTLKEYLNQDA